MLVLMFISKFGYLLEVTTVELIIGAVVELNVGEEVVVVLLFKNESVKTSTASLMFISKFGYLLEVTTLELITGGVIVVELNVGEDVVVVPLFKNESVKTSTASLMFVSKFGYLFEVTTVELIIGGVIVVKLNVGEEVVVVLLFKNESVRTFTVSNFGGGRFIIRVPFPSSIMS